MLPGVAHLAPGVAAISSNNAGFHYMAIFKPVSGMLSNKPAHHREEVDDGQILGGMPGKPRGQGKPFL